MKNLYYIEENTRIRLVDGVSEEFEYSKIALERVCFTILGMDFWSEIVSEYCSALTDYNFTTKTELAEYFLNLEAENKRESEKIQRIKNILIH